MSCISHQQEKKRELTLGLYIFMALISVLFFFVLGTREPVLFDDSYSYLLIKAREGIMPVYPLFILANQYIFGQQYYLYAIIAEQGILAIGCILFTEYKLTEYMQLKSWESAISFFLLLIPFTTDLPAAVTSQEILTEGLAYPLFYLFVLAALKAVWGKKVRNVIPMLIMAGILALIRSQMQILFVVCGVVVIYIALRRTESRQRTLWARVVIGVAACLLICLAGIWSMAKVAEGYKYMIRNCRPFYEFVAKVQEPEEYKRYLEGKSIYPTAVQQDESTLKEEKLWTRDELLTMANAKTTTSQYVSLIFSRGMYEADAEDVELFQDQTVRELYLELYDRVDEAEQRYVYATPGLWMWQDVMGGIGQIGKTCFSTPAEYYAENQPEIILSGQYGTIRNEQLKMIGFRLIKKHWGRVLYHVLVMMPQSFISTIFFQIGPIYLLCHLITLVLYLSAAGLMVWGYADRRIDNRYAEFMALVLTINIVMVGVISTIFFGQQRYLVYNFGLFYIAYGLLIEQLWKTYLQKRIMSKASERPVQEDCRE